MAGSEDASTPVSGQRLEGSRALRAGDLHHATGSSYTSGQAAPVAPRGCGKGCGLQSVGATDVRVRGDACLSTHRARRRKGEAGGQGGHHGCQSAGRWRHQPPPGEELYDINAIRPARARYGPC